MKLVVRVVAISILGSFLLTPAFAEEAAKASSSTTPEMAPGGSATSTAYPAPAYLAPAVPVFPPQAKTKAASSADTHPAVDAFIGYSFVRFSTNSATVAGNVKETFNWHGLNAWWVISASIASRTCRLT
jgi:hypothetical protein